MPTNRFMKSKSVFYALFLSLMLLLSCAANSYGAVSAGYSEYYIPGDEGNMWTIFNTLDAAATTPMHAVISVTAWSDNTSVYYDHWEDGYNFDPDNPAATADWRVVLGERRRSEYLRVSSIPLPTVALTPGTGCSPTASCYYDGGDHIYVAGGAVTVTRASWIEGVGAGNQATAWEIYPVKPQLTTYVLPFGENLGFVDFNRVFVLIQATEDNTTFQVDLDGDGTFDLSTESGRRQRAYRMADTDNHNARQRTRPSSSTERAPVTSGVTLHHAPRQPQLGDVYTGHRNPAGQIRRRQSGPEICCARTERISQGILDE